VRAGLTQLEKARRDEKDLALLNAKAERLNEEAEDVLGYQDWTGQRDPASGVSAPAGSCDYRNGTAFLRT
jgi:hypothetical protein